MKIEAPLMAFPVGCNLFVSRPLWAILGNLDQAFYRTIFQDGFYRVAPACYRIIPYFLFFGRSSVHFTFNEREAYKEKNSLDEDSESSYSAPCHVGYSLRFKSRSISGLSAGEIASSLRSSQ